ncbi:MAG TPA: phosphatidylserine/phosphatidylglycerophosphate/cardiolipin synthase family protein [Anaeromyxobacter sp.]|nr:phosphatidylserine/phosphatidylglycerophosphate/cardiolipin synthase family protein [Anaeromyxobacter sp.]
MRAGRALAAAGTALVLGALGGHLSRRIRRAQLSRRMLRLGDAVPLDVLLEREVGVPVREGNGLDLVDNGAVFDALEEEIGRARETIHISAFLWMGEGDPSDRIGRALLARRRGVACRILIDWFGSLRFDRALERRLRASGVELRRHTPFPDPFRVNHRRIFVFDGRRAFVGGFGIWRSWLGDGVADGAPDARRDWRDTAALVRGPIVGDLQRAFDHSWQNEGGEPLPAISYPRLRADGDIRAAVVASSPAWARTTSAARMYYALIASARRRLYIANSYFVPDRSLQDLLAAQARAAVDVRVLAPGRHHDVAIVHAGQRRTYARLLSGGVRIWEYGVSMMHAKTLVVDDVAVIGSANMDSQSLSFLWEASVVALDPALAARLADRFFVDLERSDEIHPAAWARRPLLQKAGQRAAWLAEAWL